MILKCLFLKTKGQALRFDLFMHDDINVEI